MRKKRIIPIFIPHLGCPFDCVFCNQRSISGEISAPSPGELAEKIKTALAIAGGSAELAFYGGSFTAVPAGLRRSLLGAAGPFLESGEISSIRISTRPDFIDDVILEELWDCGVRTIELGAQSMDDGVLSLSGRGHSAGDTARSSERIKRRGFGLGLQIMCGLPGDSEDKSLETARITAGLAPDFVRIYPVVVLKGTKLAEMYESGEYRAPELRESVGLCASMLGVFADAGIPVIRLGLNPSDELEAQVLAGPYHPAFGELAYSELYYRRARELLRGVVPGGDVTLKAPRSRVSALAGHGAINRRRLREEFGIRKLRILPADIPEGTLVLGE